MLNSPRQFPTLGCPGFSGIPVKLIVFADLITLLPQGTPIQPPQIKGRDL